MELFRDVMGRTILDSLKGLYKGLYRVVLWGFWTMGCMGVKSLYIGNEETLMQDLFLADL